MALHQPIREAQFTDTNSALRVGERFDALFEANFNPLVGWVSSNVGGDTGTAEDIVISGFLRAYPHINMEEYTDNQLKSYVWSATLRCLQDHWRKTGRREAALRELPLSQVVGHDELEDPSDFVAHVEAVDTLAMAIRGTRKLRSQELLVICMRYVDELQWNEIGDALGMSRGNVCTMAERALAKIRRANPGMQAT